MRTRGYLTLLRAAVLVGLLVAAQTAALVHSDLDDAHPSGEVCVLCVAFTTLGAGNVAGAQQLDAIVQRAEPVDYVLVHRIARRIDHRLARGPPQAS